MGEDMEIRNIITFVRIAELQNFSKAAEQLGYSQSAVTMQIKQLEAELNTPAGQEALALLEISVNEPIITQGGT